MSETVAMSVSGHRDRGVFNRYNCVSKVDQVDAMEKVAAYQNGLPRSGTFGRFFRHAGSEPYQVSPRSAAVLAGPAPVGC